MYISINLFISKNGFSTGFFLIILISKINIINLIDINLFNMSIDWILLIFRIGSIIIIINIIITIISPLNLLLIDRSVEKNNRKYHSGSICEGVLK